MFTSLCLLVTAAAVTLPTLRSAGSRIAQPLTSDLEWARNWVADKLEAAADEVKPKPKPKPTEDLVP
jgi:hypothetical protein